MRISDWSSDVCSSDLASAAIWVKRAGNGDEALVLYGNVDIREVQLAFRQPGRVAEMAFQEGDVVTAGTRMALLDAQPYEDALAAAEAAVRVAQAEVRSEEHTSELQSLMRSSYAVFCLKKKN